MTTYTYPGVYIEEFEPGAPIVGVGTSTAVFIGPAAKGDVNTPLKFTSWDAFKAAFGDMPLDGYYLWYAVRGFFENGGTVCYVLRATTGDYDHAQITDNAAAITPNPPPVKPTIDVRAKAMGSGSGITVKAGAAAAPLVSNAKVYRPDSPAIVPPINGQEVVTNDADKAARFVPGDVIDLGGTSYTVARVSGPSIFVTATVTGNPTGSINLADMVAGTTSSFRVEAPAGLNLAPGSVVRFSQTGGPDPSYSVVKSVSVQRVTSLLTTYRVDLRNPVTKAYVLTNKDVRIDSVEFALDAGAAGSWDQLSMDPAHPRYFADVIAADPNAEIVATPAVPPSVTPLPFNQPKTAAAGVALGGGANDDPSQLGATHYANALDVLESVDDVNLVCAPDSQDAAVQGELRSHCEKLKDRFAILDSKLGIEPFGGASVITQRNGLDSPKGYAALYYPWIYIAPASGSKPLLVPPSGHLAGIYARTDELRGVHKAPAGEDATVRGALGVERPLSDTDQGQLNPIGVNVIRVFKPGGVAVAWGARTTAAGVDSNWQYVNIRRLFEYLEESIQEGIKWAVFEPNNLELWQKLKRTITDFLTRAWRDGALFGATAEDAFYVRIDDALNTFATQQLGELHIEIGCRPSYPAEFIVVHIGISPGGSEITES
jgi:uncharacterized protein